MATRQKTKFLSVSFAFLVGFSVMFCSISQLGAELILFGAAHKSGGPSTLYTIETSGPSAGVATLVGPIGFDRCSAMDWDPSTGILYATCENNDDTHVLITIDPLTGVGTEVGPTGVGSSSLSALIQGSKTAPDMSFRNSDNILFAYAFKKDVLATIDLSTGTMTQIGVGPTGAVAAIPLLCKVACGNGLAFSPSDVFLFLAVEDNLLTLDQTTGIYSFFEPLSFVGFDIIPRINGMDFKPGTETLFASVRTGLDDLKTTTLATVDITTGDVTPIGTGPTVAGLDALAFVVTPLEFSTFTLKKAMVKFEHKLDNDEFMVKGKFVLGEDNNGINPVDENFTVKVGTSSIVITPDPPDSFDELTEGIFKFHGTIDGAHVKMKIQWIDDNTFNFKIMAKGVDLKNTSNPVGVKLIIGDDTGQSEIGLKGELNSWWKGKKRKKHHGDDGDSCSNDDGNSDDHWKKKGKKKGKKKYQMWKKHHGDYDWKKIKKHKWGSWKK